MHACMVVCIYTHTHTHKHTHTHTHSLAHPGQAGTEMDTRKLNTLTATTSVCPIFP